jgi:hypothetical protein
MGRNVSLKLDFPLDFGLKSEKKGMADGAE